MQPLVAPPRYGDCMRISVEAWSPEYGGELDLSALELTDDRIDTGCETAAWAPVAPSYSGELLEGPVGFVDGTRRIDARVFVTPRDGAPVAGVAGSVGAGAVVCTPRNGGGAAHAEIVALRVVRSLAVGEGTSVGLSAGTALDYAPLPVPGQSAEGLVYAVHDQMRTLEAQLAQEMADEGRLVFIDGPLAVMRPGPQKIVGFIKAHHRRYLQEDEEAVLGQLGCGERTPIFAFGEPRPRYSWYLRLCPRDDLAHEWHGLVRCEVPAALPMDAAVALADVSARLLPRFASLPQWDNRAPQNLVPVAGLERRLRHLLGDRELVYRMIRGASANGIKRGASVA
jgi:uncharacterized protein